MLIYLAVTYLALKLGIGAYCDFDIVFKMNDPKKYCQHDWASVAV